MFIFYTLSALILLAANILVNSRNPLYSLLSLVAVFICGSLQLICLGIDFIAYVFIIVYVGALAVLFLFVVIILDIKLSKLKHIKAKLHLIFTIAFICFFYLDYDDYTMGEIYILPKFLHIYDEISCIKALGIALYTKYVIHFVLCGLVLLLAIIGAIVLTSIPKEHHVDLRLVGKKGGNPTNFGPGLLTELENLFLRHEVIKI